MSSSTRLLVVIALCMSQFSYYASSFSIPDAFHVVHTAASHTSTVQTVVHHQSHAMMNLLDTYKHSLVEHPLATKMSTGATLAVTGDAIAQRNAYNADDNEPFVYDKRRATSFAVFDMAYRALQHVAFPLIVANCHGQFLQSGLIDQHSAAAMEQTLASQLGIVPFLYYPAFFALTGAVQGLDMKGAVDRAKDNFLPLMKRNLLFWIPVQFVQFGFIQEDLQIPFLSVAGLGWTFILSVAAGSAKTYAKPVEELDSAEEMMILELTEQEEVMAEAAAQAVISETEQDETRRNRVEGKLASYKA
jgi:hypothetical protein